MQPSTSPRWEISGVDFKKALRSGAVVALASFVMYFTNNYSTQVIQGISLKYSFLMPLLTIGVELLRRWATDHSASSN